MLKRFVAIREDTPGIAWRERFVAGRAETEAWYRGTGRGAPPTAAECTAQLQRHMPELLGPYERVCALVGEDDLAPQILSQFRPPPLPHGCTQAVWLGAGGPALIRNYDYPLDVVSDHFESTRWFGREVISKGQRPWGGCLDGMNADGLVASMTFGGSSAQGLGFSIILVVRYILETCSQVSEAVAALCRIPVALSQNVTLLDKTGAYATVFVGPERAPSRVAHACLRQSSRRECLDRSVEKRGELDSTAAGSPSCARGPRRDAREVDPDVPHRADLFAPCIVAHRLQRGLSACCLDGRLFVARQRHDPTDRFVRARSVRTRLRSTDGVTPGLGALAQARCRYSIAALSVATCASLHCAGVAVGLSG